MQLKEYLKKHKLNQKEFAERLGTSEMSVSYYCRNKKMPCVKIMKKIVKLTKRQVMPNDFYGISEVKNAK